MDHGHVLCKEEEEHRIMALVIGLMVAVMVIAGLVVMTVCYFCPGCILYKKRRSRSSGPSQRESLIGESSVYSQQTHTEDLQPGTCYYPVGIPPAYPNDCFIQLNDKQSHNPNDLPAASDDVDVAIRQSEALDHNPNDESEITQGGSKLICKVYVSGD